MTGERAAVQADINRALLSGVLVCDPQSASLAPDVGVCVLRLDVHGRFPEPLRGLPRPGFRRFEVAVLGGLAGVCAAQLREGAQIVVDGTLHTCVLRDSSGSRRWTGVLAERVQFGGRRNVPSQARASLD